MFLNKKEYVLEKYKNLTRFTGILDCRGKNSPCFSKYRCDKSTNSCKYVSKNETVDVYESYAECSEKCGGLAFPNTDTGVSKQVETQNPAN